jgi:hypothetical protein
VNNDEKIKAIEAWQANEELHPLTCGEDSNHHPLRPDEDENGSVILRCPDCDYTQDNIPSVVFEMIQTFDQADKDLKSASLEAQVDQLAKTILALDYGMPDGDMGACEAAEISLRRMHEALTAWNHFIVHDASYIPPWEGSGEVWAAKMQKPIRLMRKALGIKEDADEPQSSDPDDHQGS